MAGLGVQLAASRNRTGKLPAGSGLSLGGGSAGAGKKRGMEPISEITTEETVPMVAGASELLLLPHKINVLLNELQ